MVVPVDPRDLGLWLTGLFGDPDTTDNLDGSGDHEFASGGDDLPELHASRSAIAALTGRIDVRFADTTLIDLAAGGTPVDLEFAYTLSAEAKLVLTAHEVYLPEPSQRAVEGPGGVQTSVGFSRREER